MVRRCVLEKNNFLKNTMTKVQNLHLTLLTWPAPFGILSRMNKDTVDEHKIGSRKKQKIKNQNKTHD